MLNDYFIHELAAVTTENIGTGSRIWQFVIVLSDAKIGVDTNICSHCFIENNVIIGDRVTIKNGVSLYDGLRIGNDVFIGPNVAFTNDKYPRSKHTPAKFLETYIDNGASIGAGAVILPGIRIGQNAMVGAGSVVTRSVPQNAIVVGNPARIVGYVDAVKSENKVNLEATSHNLSNQSTRVPGVSLIQMPRFADIRGSLSVGEFAGHVPFGVKRYFLVFDVPSIETRGEHVHKACHQLLICVHGSCSVVADDGIHREELVLNRPDIGLHLPPMVWGIQYNFSADTVLLVFASEHYDSEDYIRNYNEFKEIKGIK